MSQRHRLHLITSHFYVNEENEVSFHEFFSWTLFYPLKNQFFNIFLNFLKNGTLNIFGHSNFESKSDKFDMEPEYWCWFFASSPLPSFFLHFKNHENKFMSLYETQNKSYIQKISLLFPKIIMIAFRALILVNQHSSWFWKGQLFKSELMGFQNG